MRPLFKLLLIFLYITISVTAVIHKITVPTTTIPPPTTTTKRENLENLVDRIEAIDVSSTQAVITTSKVGTADDAQVSIDVIDLATGEKLPPVNLTGILLVITRGRYTINFLKPNTWYGIAFRAKQQHRKPNGATYVDFEEHLIHTHREDGSNMDSEPVVSVQTKRLGADGKSMENLVLTLRWEQHPDDRLNLNTLANLTLFCQEHIKYKQIILDQREIEKSVEVKLDNIFEVLEQHNNSRHITASITPKHCHKICWVAEIYAEAGGYHFQREVSKKCESIETVTAKTTLRDYQSYQVKENNLTIFTKYLGEGNDTIERDAYVQLTAIGLPENNSRIVNGTDNTTRYKLYSTALSSNFTLSDLIPGRVYAIQYTYAKQSPFAYAESRRFIVETPYKGTIGKAVNPIKVVFGNSKAKMLTNNTVQPSAVIKLDPLFEKYKVGLDLEPFCRQLNGTHIWLDSEHNEHHLNEADVKEIVCAQNVLHGQNRRPSFCNKTKDGKEEKDKGKKETPEKTDKSCVPNLCYTTSIVVKEKVYSMERRCENLGHLYPLPPPQKDSESFKNFDGLRNSIVFGMITLVFLLF